MIALAVEQAERMLREGNAPTQVVLHYLKLGASREKMEQELLKKQLELADAKIESLQAAKDRNEMYKAAMEAFMSYQSSSLHPEDMEE